MSEARETPSGAEGRPSADMIRRVAVVGCGLLGGSFGLALRHARPGWQVVAVDKERRLEAIAAAGAAHEVASVDALGTVLPTVDWVVLAAPIEGIMAHLAALAPHLRPGTLVTDVGSTKSAIAKRAWEMLPPSVTFVGGHPIAGGATGGVEAATRTMFCNRVYVLCPHLTTAPKHLLELIDLVEDFGAWPLTMEPEEHDHVLAMLSHLPQLLSVALLDAAVKDDASHQLMDLVAGPAFREMTRIGVSDPEVWRGILDTNRPAVNRALDQFIRSLEDLRQAWNTGGLAEVWEPARARRRALGIPSWPRLRIRDLRRWIDHYDRLLLETIACRMDVARRIGELKRRMGRPVHDVERERELYGERERWASALGLTWSTVRRVLETIIGESRTLQGERSETLPETVRHD